MLTLLTLGSGEVEKLNYSNSVVVVGKLAITIRVEDGGGKN